MGLLINENKRQKSIILLKWQVSYWNVLRMQSFLPALMDGLPGGQGHKAADRLL